MQTLPPATVSLALLLLAPLSLAWLPASAEAQSEVVIQEWEVPWANSRPRDPFAESATSVWFVGQGGGYLGHLDAATGEMTKVDLEEGSGPHNVIVDENGSVWYAGNRKGLIGRYDPKTGELDKIPMPDGTARDPHTLVADGHGNIWFTVQGGNFVGRLKLDSRQVDLIPSKTLGSRPYGIKVAPGGAIWVALFGTHKLARIDPRTLALTEVVLPRKEARPRRLEILQDGRVWYVDYAQGQLGVYDPANHSFEEWVLPQGTGSQPYGMASDSEGRLWIVASGLDPNQFLGFDPKTKTFASSTPIPSGGGTVRHMHYHAPSGTVWFGTDTNTIGRARLPRRGSG